MDLNAYRQDSFCLREQVSLCPLCPGKPLWNNGSYLRHFPTERPGETVQVLIFRKLCPECRTSFSLHPEHLLKRQRYSLTFVAAWLWAFLKDRISIRDRSFLEIHNVTLPIDDPKMSWSDSLDYPGQRTRPGYQLLRYWSVLFCWRAEILLPELMAAFNQSECFKKPAKGWPVPERAGSLQLAWLHWEVLWRARSADPAHVDLKEAFRQLVRLLAKAPSHKVHRVAGGRYSYDVLIQ